MNLLHLCWLCSQQDMYNGQSLWFGRVDSTLLASTFVINYLPMLIFVIRFLRSLLLNLHLWLQCLLLTPSYSRKRINNEAELVSNTTKYYRSRKKPNWVVRETIRLLELLIAAPERTSC